MKVCVTGTRGFPLIEGGVECHCEALYPLLDSSVDITVFRRKPFINNKNRNSDYTNISFIDLPSTTIKGFEALLHSFLSAFRIIFMRPDIVHIHNIGPALFAPLIKLSGAKIVLTYHSPNYEHDKWNSVSKKLLKLSEKIALTFSDRIIFVNSFQLAKYDEKIRKKSVYIPNGINEPVFSERTEALEKFGIEKNKYVLAIGRITPEKGFDTLIKAFNASEASALGYKLVIAGGVEFENSYKKELLSLAENKNVIFTDFVYGDYLNQLYTNAALFVLSSVNEGFPLVLLEAMSYGLDIIASDIPASRLVKIDEENYFKCGDKDSLAEKLNLKIRNIQRKEYDLSEFSWEDVADKVFLLYSDLLNEG